MSAAAESSRLWQYIAVGVILAAVVAVIIIRAVRRRRCGDGGAPPLCSGCALADNCLKARDKRQDGCCH